MGSAAMAIVLTAVSEMKLESNSNVKGWGGSKKKENGSQLQLPEDHTLSQSSEIVEEMKIKKKRNKNPGVRQNGCRINDPRNRKSCHQCRRKKTMDIMAPCKNKKRDKRCKIKYCHKCLLIRYGEKVSVVEDWFCPKCRDICNCSCCRKTKGRNHGISFLQTGQGNGQI